MIVSRVSDNLPCNYRKNGETQKWSPNKNRRQLGMV